MAMEGRLKRIVWICVLVLIERGANMSVAQPSTLGCRAPLLSLSSCAGFLNASNPILPANPPQGCCSALASLFQTSGMCFCQLLSFVPSNPFPVPFGFPINQTQALTLPGSCKITTPPCKVAGAPAISPASSPDAAGRGATATSPNVGTQLAPPPSTTTTSEAPSATIPASPSPSIPPPTSETGALYTPSFLIVSTGLILGSMIW